MDGIQRLDEMIKGQKDKYLIKIVNYLMLQNEMNQDFLKEEKNLKDMAEYIIGLAEKEATNRVAVIEDETVYQWAKDYFIKSNKELGIKKVKLEKIDKERNAKTDDEFGSIFSTEKIEVQKEEIEQVSFFGA